MVIGPTNVNRQGVPHGGAIAALIDHTGGHAAAVLAGRRGPTVDMTSRFLTTPSGSVVRADARMVRVGRQFVVIDVAVADAANKLVAIRSVLVSPHDTRGPSPADDTVLEVGGRVPPNPAGRPATSS